MSNKLTTQEKARIDFVKHLAKIIYPDYTGRKFGISYENFYYPQNYWDGGSRVYCVAVDFKGNRVIMPSHESQVPYNQQAHQSFRIPPGVGILEHRIFCGKDCGITLVVGVGETKVLEDSYQNLLTAQKE